MFLSVEPPAYRGAAGAAPGAAPGAAAVPLAGFGKAYDGPAIDPKVLEEQQKKLQEELEKRSDELRKRLEQSGTAAAPGASPGAAPAAPR